MPQDRIAERNGQHALHDERDFEFCTKYELPIRPVVRPLDGGLASPVAMQAAYCEYGIVEHSGRWSGKTSEEAREEMAAYAEQHGFGKSAITFRIKDWGVSRQRYWGTPIPIVHCPTHGPVAVPDEQLPVLLPENVEITQEGGSPLAKLPEFVNATCPRCGGPARRETDTMDTFVDSSWYFYRYTSATDATAPFDTTAVSYWFPIDQYIGGVEHAILHLIYSRFWTKVMRDFGLLSFDEPFTRLMTQGMLLNHSYFRRSDNGNAVYNPFVGNYIMDAFTTEIGGEVYLKAASVIAMGAVTGGEIRGTVLTPGQRGPTYIGKLGFDRQVKDDLRVRLTGSMYKADKALNNTLYGGDRAGSRYYYVLENTSATETAQKDSGLINPGFRNRVTAFQMNPFVKFRGLELFGVVERAEGKASTETREEFHKATQWDGQAQPQPAPRATEPLAQRDPTAPETPTQPAPGAPIYPAALGGGNVLGAPPENDPR